MAIVLTGLSHKTAPVEVRECLALSKERVGEALGELVDGKLIRERLVVSTCNRVEVLAVVDDARVAEGAERVLEVMTGGRGFPRDLVSKHVYTRFRSRCAAETVKRFAKQPIDVTVRWRIAVRRPSSLTQAPSRRLTRRHEQRTTS